MLLGGMCFSSNYNINKVKAAPKDDVIVLVSRHQPGYETRLYYNSEVGGYAYLIEKYYNGTKILTKRFYYGAPTDAEESYIHSFTVENLSQNQRNKLGV